MLSARLKDQTPMKLITCIVPTGDGLELAEKLYEKHGLTGINVTPGRGASQRSRTIADEVDLLTVTVPEPEADQVFAFIYDATEIATKPHRLMFQTELTAATIYLLPDLPSAGT
jgi:hypothetical protein